MNAKTTTSMDLYAVSRVVIEQPNHTPTKWGEPFVSQRIVFYLEDGSNLEVNAIFEHEAAKALADAMLADKQQAA